MECFFFLLDMEKTDEPIKYCLKNILLNVENPLNTFFQKFCCETKKDSSQGVEQENPYRVTDQEWLTDLN